MALAARSLARCLAPPVALAAAVTAAAHPGAEDDALWSRLRQDGHVVLVRHAVAPGNHDPPGFVLEDCSTQRNLSEAGREQARSLGRLARARGMRIGKVLSSRWCRARETASLAFGAYEPWAELDYFVGGDQSDLPRRVARMKEAIGAWKGPGTLVLVSNHLLISNVVERGVPEATMFVLAPRPDGSFEVLGTVAAQE
jgi:phosphohistidine phosphatase SixA